MKRILAVAALIAALTCVMSAGAAEPTYVVDGCAAKGVRPTSVTIFCGDNGLLLDQLAWSSFGGPKARATGRKVVRTCKPDCASGGVRTSRVRLVFSDRRTCHGFSGRYYQKVKAVSAKATKHYAVPCPF